MTDTRKDKRAPVSLKVRFKSATLDEFVEQYSRDISQGGLFIKSKSPMAIGTLLKFELQLKDESKLIQGVGRVVWKREASEAGSDDAPAGMGIKFIKMDPESRALVDRIVDQRGAQPGQYEAGGGDNSKEPDDVVASPAAARPVRSAKATMQFFPAAATSEADLPPPEDRTQVRQASEFLAAALAGAGGTDDLAQEAEKKAEEARERTAQIEREREAAAQRARDEADARERAEKEARERAEREKAERAAAEKAAEEKAKKDAEDAKKAEEDAKKAEEDAKKAKKADEDAKKAEATKKDEPAPKKDEAKPAAAEKAPEKTAPKAAPKVAPKAPDAPPPAEPKSNLLPIFLVLVLVLGAGGYFLFGGGGSTTTPTQPATTEPTPPTPPAEEPPAEAPTTEAPVADAPPEAPAEPEAPPAPPIHFDVRTTPPGAELFVGGESRGTAPTSLDLPAGEVTVVARLAGYREASSTVTLAEGQAPVAITLEALPYAVEVTSTPPGASVRIGSRTVTTPGRVEIPRPTRDLRVQATLTGYTAAASTVAPSAFEQTSDAMLAHVELTLTAVARPRAVGGRELVLIGVGGVGGDGVATEPSGGGGGAAEPTPAPEPSGGGGVGGGGSAAEPSGGGGGGGVGGGGGEDSPPENPF